MKRNNTICEEEQYNLFNSRSREHIYSLWGGDITSDLQVCQI